MKLDQGEDTTQMAPSFGKALSTKPLLSLTNSRLAWQYFFSSGEHRRHCWNVSHLRWKHQPTTCEVFHLKNENCRQGCEHSHLAGKLFRNKCQHPQVIREPSRPIRKRSFSTTEDTESTENFVKFRHGDQMIQYLNSINA